ncbi:CobW family GTP-binding protein [Achromobacter xylosoxidans]|uniref:GTP-binding protein n=1 Tax=Alcaligenes xylosoxydans xylosoxydans TaxID=85698 RepID=A0A424WJI2_ALCXX|nr:GTP-binding protein [Achromobacter xylosoxidans]MBC9904644.1 GTP-binding protein [Achromobacter xylosoxidans]MBD0868186.1 GTP-binding protein [Achromobacter xylosoxidans]QNP85438.1 GTP-binding protein [Achromobacter xylosoxidans]RPJ93342.1 GTP-binding protein [Achromobacter xylosoxidans]
MPTTAGPLPVYLLTGFLGSGKTTLLSRLVRSPRFADTAVVINEFGEIGLDHMLVGRADDTDVVLLDSGCLCCAATSSLQDTLESLYYRRQRGEIPAFTRVVVETSGLADPCPVINTLAADPLIARHYRFGGVVATADALHGLPTLDAYREASTQIAIADRIALTKTDLADEAAVGALRVALRGYNASAPIRPVSPDTVDGDAPALFDGLRAEHLDVAALHAAPTAGPLAHVLRYGIVSYAFTQSRPVGWEDYARWTRHMQRQVGDRLLRAKGLLLWTDGTLRAVHGVRHVFSVPEPVEGADGAQRAGAMVLIVQDMSAEDVDEAIRPLGL